MKKNKKNKKGFKKKWGKKVKQLGKKQKNEYHQSTPSLPEFDHVCICICMIYMNVCGQGRGKKRAKEEGESGKGDEASVRNLGGVSETWLIWG